MKAKRYLWNVRYIVCTLTFIGGLSNATGSAANTVYVASTGNDAVSCSQAQNIATPKRTIQEAVGCLDAGDTLYIRGGTYAEGITIGPQLIVGTASQPITISGYQNERPLIQPPSSWTGHIFVFDAASSEADGNIRLTNVDLDGINSTTEGRHCIDLAMNGVTIDNITCTDPSYDGINLGARRTVIRNSTFLNAGRLTHAVCEDIKGVGIYVSYDHNLIENNVIDGSRAGGILLQYNTPTDNIIRNNTLRNFGTKSPHYHTNASSCLMGRVTGTGMNFGPGAQRNQIYNNIFAHIRGEQQDADAFLWWADDAIDNSIWNNTIDDVDVALWNAVGAVTADVQNNIFSNILTYTFGDTTNFTLSNNLVNPADELGGGATPTPTVSLTATPASAQPGSLLTITWSVTASQASAYDWVGLFKTGDPNTSYDESRWLYTNGNTTGSVSWNAPSTPGTYEARYLLDNGYTDVARSSPVTVSSTASSVKGR